MGIITSDELKQDSELKQRIVADLRNRARTEAMELDPIEDSAYLKDHQKTRHFPWFWLILVLLAMLSLVFIIIF